MKIIFDMNLAPDWIEYLSSYGFDSLHWSSVGNIRATDEEIFNWAKENNSVIITQDMDFSAILALSNAQKPSVILIRSKDSLPETIGKQIIEILSKFKTELQEGAHIVFDSKDPRVRILPLNISKEK